MKAIGSFDPIDPTVGPSLGVCHGPIYPQIGIKIEYYTQPGSFRFGNVRCYEVIAASHRLD
ncbi:unnamed protein product [Prunus armeniaca]|uniref:Uncharacterized protein n=1 Tax=Prunus armeniaca TaxID=36596 RepID=A0A6J5X334_PRUAR|nr:unnamed protein product [Prunus armeniaca]CAB4305308.1 unnamed protein product [Prunus armeniaca]